MKLYACIVLGFLGWAVVATVVTLVVGGVVRLRERHGNWQGPLPIERAMADLDAAHQRREGGAR